MKGVAAARQLAVHHERAELAALRKAYGLGVLRGAAVRNEPRC